MDLTEIVPHVYRLGVPTSGVFLLVDERVTLIDTGPRWSSRKRIFEALGDLGRSPGDIERIVLTHAHPDHYGALVNVHRETESVRLAHPLDAAVVRGERGTVIPAPRGIRLVYSWFFSRFLEPNTEIDIHLEDGQVLPVLGGTRVVHTPGHTDGHVALLLEEHGVLLSGDALQVNRDGELTPPLIGGDEGDARRSLAVMAELDFEVIAPSHFEPQRDDARARLAVLAATHADDSG